MKSIRATFFMICVGVLFSCSGEQFNGIYTCADCLYTQLEFKDGGKVEILAGGIKALGDFAVEENKVTVTTETSEYIFLIKDDHTLEGQDDAEGIYVKGQ
ncbi:MAG: hypothetical protein ACPGJS_00420 [Flammeovirgaceae bacterium]